MEKTIEQLQSELNAANAKIEEQVLEIDSLKKEVASKSSELETAEALIEDMQRSLDNSVVTKITVKHKNQEYEVCAPRFHHPKQEGVIVTAAELHKDQDLIEHLLEVKSGILKKIDAE